MTATLQSRLRVVMREQGLSQADLARALEAQQSTVSRWVANGHISVDPHFAFRLEDLYGYSPRWVLFGEGPVHVLDVALQIVRAAGFEVSKSSLN